MDNWEAGGSKEHHLMDEDSRDIQEGRDEGAEKIEDEDSSRESETNNFYMIRLRESKFWLFDCNCCIWLKMKQIITWTIAKLRAEPFFFLLPKDDTFFGHDGSEMSNRASRRLNRFWWDLRMIQGSWRRSSAFLVDGFWRLRSIEERKWYGTMCDHTVGDNTEGNTNHVWS